MRYNQTRLAVSRRQLTRNLRGSIFLAVLLVTCSIGLVIIVSTDETSKLWAKYSLLAIAGLAFLLSFASIWIAYTLAGLRFQLLMGAGLDFDDADLEEQEKTIAENLVAPALGTRMFDNNRGVVCFLGVMDRDEQPPQGVAG